MHLRRISPSLPLADPEEGFSVEGDLSKLVLRFRDWTGKKHSITFTDVTKFVMDIYPLGPKELWPLMPKDGSIDEVMDSEYFTGLRQAGDVMPTEEMHHYLAYHNEEEYCEIIAASIVVGSERDPPPDDEEHSGS